MRRRVPEPDRSGPPDELVRFEQAYWWRAGDRGGFAGELDARRRWVAARHEWVVMRGLPAGWWFWWSWPEATRARWRTRGVDPPPRSPVVRSR